MKILKKILFSMLLLCVGLLTVKAAEAEPTNIPLWKSYVGTVSDNTDNNACKDFQAVDAIDVFLAENGTKCVVTGVEKVEYDVDDATSGYIAMIQPATESIATGETIYGAVTDSVNNTADTEILLSEIVELIYSDSSKTTQKLKAFALQQERANGATSYILKAGSSDNALYVYGGYEGGTMSSIKLTFDASTKKITYSITMTTDNEEEFYLAVYFTRYLIDYIMEASPNYDSAISIVGDTSKWDLIKSDFVNTYGEVINYTTPALKIEVDVFAKGDINNQIVALYDAAVNTSTSSPSIPENDGNNSQEEDDGGNPNTGAFVNIFAIVALISVGTVLILGNKRKLFRI